MHTYDTRKSRFSFARLGQYSLEMVSFETTNRHEAMVFLNAGYVVYEYHWDDKKAYFVFHNLWNPNVMIDVRGFWHGYSSWMAKIPGRLPT